MKFTDKQLKDLETIEYFIPWDNLPKIEIKDEDRQMFLENSEQGKHKDKIEYSHFKANLGFNYLLQGKRWRGIHMHELYEPGVLEGTMPYFVILGGYKGEEIIPRAVIDFMKKEMFKGKDAEIIERIYQEILDA